MTRFPFAPAWTATALLLAAAGARTALDTSADDTRAVRAAAARLAALPIRVGEWVGEEAELDRESLRLSGAAEGIARRYTHRATGRTATLLVLCGPPGPVAVHPPTACYRGLGYTLVGRPGRLFVQGKSAGADAAASPGPASSQPIDQDAFHLARFVPPAGDPSPPVRLAWGWSTDGRWSVPDHPRLAFAGETALFKLYAASEATDASQAALPDFLTVLVPAMRTTVFEAPDDRSSIN